MPKGPQSLGSKPCRRKHKRLQSDAELDITAFMNFDCPGAVLLINMVVAQTSILDLNFPRRVRWRLILKQLQLQVIVLPDQLVVSDNQGA